MSDDRFQLVMRTFERALELDAAARDEFLEREVGHEPEVFKEVRALLAHHESDGSRVATGVGLAAVGPPSAACAASDAPALPVLTGNYRILRTIGEGGMGIVFEAEQSFPRRRVALKAVRPGFASRGLLNRFRNEVELLGRLQHPGIAQLYEAGIADELSPDQAFFAMELVDGPPLTRYVREHNPPTAVRWELLLRVAEAVQHAHQRGVIHRDLKPGNILVGSDGNPKVVDFGIARASEEGAASMATRTGQLIGTPSYMSPEQMRGDVVDTRSDVYALGVVAFELLTGHLPFDLTNKGMDEASRIIREDEAPPLSRVDRALRGDGEVIVAKCLSKEPDRRYASAGELAEDIRRLLAGDAILARRDSAMYVLRKQVRRHRTAARLIVLGAVALVAFAVYASINAERQRHLAETATLAREQERIAKERALEASRAALAARAEAEAELAQAQIERGRIEAANGNLSLAEDMLWRAHFADPASPSARWGVWELYDRIPSAWVVQGPAANTTASVSADQRRFAWPTSNGLVSVWDTRSGDPVATLLAPGGTAPAVAISPEGDQVFVLSARGGSYLLPVEGPGVSIALEDVTAQRVAAYRPDGALLATAGDDRILRLVDPRRGEVVRSWEISGTPRHMAFSHDGALLAVGSSTAAAGPAVSVWNVADGALVADLSSLGLPMVCAMTFFPRTHRLALGQVGGPIWYWEPGATGLTAARHPLAADARILSPASDGRSIYAGTLDRPYLVDVSGERENRRMARHRFHVQAVAWHGEDDVTLLTADGAMRRMSLSTNASASRIPGFQNWCFSVAYSPDGSRLAVGTGNSLVDVIDSRSRALVSRWTSDVKNFRTRQVRFLDDDRLLASGHDGVVRIIDAASGRELHAMPGDRDELFSLAVTPDRSLAAAGHANRITRIFDLRTQEPVAVLPTLEKRIEGLDFSPDGKLLAVSGLWRGVVIWDVVASTIVQRVEAKSQPWAVAFAPAGDRLYVTTQAGTIEAYSTTDWSRVRSVHGHQRLIPALAVSPDGRLIATGGEDAILKVWDAATLRNLASFDTEGVVIVSMAFSSDSRRLAAASANRFVVEYDLGAADRRIAAHRVFHLRRLGLPAPR